MSRSSWNFATALPVSGSGGDEGSDLVGRGRVSRSSEVALERDGELGEIAVADDPPELALGFEHTGGGPSEPPSRPTASA